jgi:hypothetical protein
MNQKARYRSILTKMGYYNYQSGLISNYLQQEGRWDSHLDHCRALILESIDHLKPSTVTVLGSGWLLDLPLAEMMERSCHVVLVDIVHPPEVIIQAGKLKNVVLVEADVTGGLIDEVWNMTKGISLFRKKIDFGSIVIPEFKPDFDTGLVISLNLLTQLETRIVVHIGKKTGLSSSELIPFRKAIQENHLGFLRRHDSVMISDYEEHVIRKSGESSVTTSLLADLTGEEITRKWTWEFDLTGRENYNSTVIFKELAVKWTKDANG